MVGINIEPNSYSENHTFIQCVFRTHFSQIFADTLWNELENTKLTTYTSHLFVINVVHLSIKVLKVLAIYKSHKICNKSNLFTTCLMINLFKKIISNFTPCIWLHSLYVFLLLAKTNDMLIKSDTMINVALVLKECTTKWRVNGIQFVHKIHSDYSDRTKLC